MSNLLAKVFKIAKHQRELPEHRITGLSLNQYLITFPENQPTRVDIIDAKDEGFNIKVSIDYRQKSLSRDTYSEDDIINILTNGSPETFMEKISI